MVKNIALNQDIQKKFALNQDISGYGKITCYLTRMFVKKMLLKPGLFQKKFVLPKLTHTHTHTHTHTIYNR